MHLLLLLTVSQDETKSRLLCKLNNPHDKGAESGRTSAASWPAARGLQVSQSAGGGVGRSFIPSRAGDAGGGLTQMKPRLSLDHDRMGSPVKGVHLLERPELESRQESPLSVTVLLREWKTGQPAAFDKLIELAYPELHRIARRQCGREGLSSTLQCTAVVHEAWLRLVQGQHADFKDRTHFFAFASRLMRSILIDHARARKSRKRGGDRKSTRLNSS